MKNRKQKIRKEHDVSGTDKNGTPKKYEVIHNLSCKKEKEKDENTGDHIRKIRHQTSNIRHQTSDIRHQTSSIKHQKSDIKHQTSNNICLSRISSTSSGTENPGRS